MSTIVDEKLITSIIGRDDNDEVVCIDKFIGDEQMQLLMNRLRSAGTRNKRRIALRGNCIGGSGAKALADLLRNNTTLESVSLEWNQIGSTGCSMLADALLSNNTITHLDLRNNGIADDGAVSLSHALSSSGKSIKTLDLRWNQISDKGAESFHDILANSYPPMSLLLAGNNISAQGLARIEELCRQKPVREVLPPPPPQPLPAEEKEPSYSEELLQAKVQISLLKKDIEHLRQQNMLLQGSMQGSETQLSNCALRITELEQNLMREESKNAQLHEALSDTRERLAKVTDEQGRLVAAWEVERNEWIAAKKEAQREREAELRTVTAERDSNRELARKAEESATRANQQLVLLSDQLERDRRAHQEELREALNRANDLNIQEARLRHENGTLKSSLARATDRISSLESELASAQKTHEETLLVERRRQEREIEKLRTEWINQKAVADERIAKLTAEATAAKTALIEKETALSRRQLDMQKEHEDAMDAMRQSERSRWESSVSELKQRLELVSSARRECEDRCNHYMHEIKGLNDSHLAANAELQAHLTSVEDELRRQRSLNSSLRDALSTTEADNKGKALDLEDARKKLRDSDELCKATQRHLQESNTEKAHLKGQVARLNETVSQNALRRRQEFATIEQSIKDAVGKEFETLQVRLQYLEGASK